MSDFKIIIDSGCELPDEYKEDARVSLVPFRLEINGVPYKDVDDNVKKLISKVAEAKAFINSVCPSPDMFFDYLLKGEEKRVYLITISSKLSSCYISAMLAKKMYEDKYNDKEIYVIDSGSTAGGVSQLVIKAIELEEQNVTGEALKKQLLSFKDGLRTDILMDNVESICNNIKLPKFKDVLNAANNINLKDNCEQLVGNVVEGLKNATAQTRIVITHCNNIIEAEKIRDLLIEKTGIKNIVILSASGINSMLTNMGGVIVSY